MPPFKIAGTGHYAPFLHDRFAERRFLENGIRTGIGVIFLISVASSSLLTQKGMSPQLKTCTSSEEVMIGYLGKVNAFT